MLDDRAVIERLRKALAQVIVGKEDVIELVLVGVLAGGHVLLEDVPGVGKTTLAKAIARVFDVPFARVQFTPDLLPSDILGSQLLDPQRGTFAFHKGPIFTSVLLADEINRASPRTQSALLEAMNEAQATVDGVTHPLERPFFVIATQNPTDASGTYPLPEAQLDRFLLRLGIGYPSEEAELRILFAHQRAAPIEDVPKLATGAEWLALQAKVREIKVADDVGKFILRIARATRAAKELELGVSPRGALGLFRASQARAFLSARAYVSPDDVVALAPHVLAHRIRLSSDARYAGKNEEALVRALVATVDVPT